MAYNPLQQKGQLRSGKNANRRYYRAQDHSTKATIWRKTDMLKDRVWRFTDGRKRHDFVVLYSHAFGQFQCILLFCFFFFWFLSLFSFFFFYCDWFSAFSKFQVRCIINSVFWWVHAIIMNKKLKMQKGFFFESQLRPPIKVFSWRVEN